MGHISQDGIQEDIKIRKTEGDALENSYVCGWYVGRQVAMSNC